MLYEVITERPVNPFHQLENAENFSLDLVRGHENMGIILMKGPDPEQAGKDAAEFMAVNQSDFPLTQGQILVGMGCCAVKQHSAGAVHGLDVV